MVTARHRPLRSHAIIDISVFSATQSLSLVFASLKKWKCPSLIAVSFPVLETGVKCALFSLDSNCECQLASYSCMTESHTFVAYLTHFLMRSQQGLFTLRGLLVKHELVRLYNQTDNWRKHLNTISVIQESSRLRVNALFHVKNVSTQATVIKEARSQDQNSLDNLYIPTSSFPSVFPSLMIVT